MACRVRYQSSCRENPRSLTESAMAFLSTWKWVLLYTVAIFLSLPFTRRFMDGLEAQDLQGLLSLSILFCLMALAALFVRFLKRKDGLPRQPGLTIGLLVLSAAFLAAMVWMTSVTIERIHFFEYGLLAFLCLLAAGRRHQGFRRFFHAGAAALAIGFLDEVVQGLLPTRYYDSRDLLLNMTASGLVLLGGVALFRYDDGADGKGAPKNATGTKGSDPRRKRLAPTPSDMIAALLLAFVALAFVWIRAVQWDPVLLSGCWERENRCGIGETIQIDPAGSIVWRDQSGAHASGTFEIAGNRLDGPQLRITVTAASGSGDCAWRVDRGRDRYYWVDERMLLFRIEPFHPFWRCESHPF